MIFAPDGSILGPDGRVLFFTAERFLRDVVSGEACFICGRRRSDVPFNDEHVVPDWILRRFKLHARTLRLPNNTPIRYDQYKVPCCQDCNSDSGRALEGPVRDLLTGGYDAFAERAQQNAEQAQHLLYSWLALIFLKTHLRDLALRFVRDGRLESPQIGELYDWNSLHHVHCISRSVHGGTLLGPSVVGTLLALKAGGHGEGFDYGDNYMGRAVLVRIDDIALIAVLNDAGCTRTLYRDTLGIISGAVASLQLREILAQLAYRNRRLDPRPRFYTTTDALTGRLKIEASAPELFGLKGTSAEEFGRLFYEVTRDIIEQAANRDQLRRGVLSGRWTFLQDGEGKFIDADHAQQLAPPS